jgi:hypothetical protein
MSSMKTGVPGGQAAGPRDSRLADSKGGRVADRQLKSYGARSEDRVFGESPVGRPSGNAPTRADSDVQREAENLRQQTAAAPLTK